MEINSLFGLLFLLMLAKIFWEFITVITSFIVFNLLYRNKTYLKKSLKVLIIMLIYEIFMVLIDFMALDLLSVGDRSYDILFSFGLQFISLGVIISLYLAIKKRRIYVLAYIYNLFYLINYVFDAMAYTWGTSFFWGDNVFAAMGVLFVISYSAPIVMLFKNIKTNYISETMNSKSFEIDIKKEQNKEKRKKRKLFFLCVIPLYLLLAVVPGMIVIYFELDDYTGVKVVENNTYNFNDINSDLTVNPFPKELPKGQKYTFDYSDMQLGSTESDAELLTLVVGEDIEPGIYTIKATGLVNVYTTFTSDFDYYIDESYYNIPLMEGDSIESYFMYGDQKSDQAITLTAQDKYVDYKPGINGIFVYGLNQFDSEVEFEKDSYDSLVYGYNDPYDNSYAHLSHYGDHVKLKGSSGSYFAVQYNNEEKSQ